MYALVHKVTKKIKVGANVNINTFKKKILYKKLQQMFHEPK